MSMNLGQFVYQWIRTTAGSHEHAHDFGMAMSHCHMQRRPARRAVPSPRCPRIKLGAGPDEQLGDFGLALPRGQVERRPSERGSRVDVGAFIEQHSHHIEMAMNDGAAEGEVAGRGPGVHVGTVGQVVKHCVHVPTFGS